MLMMTRKPVEAIKLTVKGKPIDGLPVEPDLEISIIIFEVRGKQVKLGIEAPPDKVKILRGELVE